MSNPTDTKGTEVHIIFGPPGTGKTTELMSLLETELKTHLPKEVAYVSFTKEGVEQGIQRAVDKFGFSRPSLPYFRTLHSLAFQQLKLKRPQVMAYKHYRQFSKKMGMNFLGYYTADLTGSDDKYLFFDELHRNNPSAAKMYIDDMDVEKLAYVVKNYKKFKDTFQLLDYTDMIKNFNIINEPVPVKIAFVDEAQDLTTLQWKMVWTAFRHCETIYIAGDDDQAIYQWSGADVDYFLSIEGKQRVLKHSYRLPDSILRFSKRITSQISHRITKDYNGIGIEGDVIYCNSIDEVPIDLDQTYMFLSRNNVFLNDVEVSLMRRKLIYERKGVCSFSSKDMDLIKTYERSRHTRSMTDAEVYALQGTLKKVYDLTQPWYEAFNWSVEKTNYIRDLVVNKVRRIDPKIKVGTMHSVKGGEADNVVMLLDVTKTVYDNIHKNPDAEHRVFYVAATRAKKRLYVINSQSRFGYPIVRY